MKIYHDNKIAVPLSVFVSGSLIYFRHIVLNIQNPKTVSFLLVYNDRDECIDNKCKQKRLTKNTFMFHDR